MSKIIPVALFFLSFFASLVSNAILRQLSKNYNFLLDRPDKHRKFHPRPTPLTGGLGISIGIIFSAIFLVFFSQPFDIAQNKEEQNIQESSIQHEIKLDGFKVIVQKYDDDSYTIKLPSGEVLLYEASNEVDLSGSASFKIIENPNTLKLNQFGISLIMFTILVQILMLYDDLWGLSALRRLGLQSFCVLGLYLTTGVSITSLGNLFGFGEFTLGFMSVPFTIFCIVGMMNAFNMIDGLNGLCASLCLVCFMSIIYMVNVDNVLSLFPLILPVGAISGFLMYNLGFLGDKRTVFLGDNGSNALGFMCAWLLVYFSSIENSGFAPVTALWLVAIPLIDAVRVMFSRALKKVKIFDADREHIHHKLFDSGFENSKIYILLILSSGVIAYVGLLLNNSMSANHFYSFYIFLILSACYYLGLRSFKNDV